MCTPRQRALASSRAEAALRSRLCFRVTRPRWTRRTRASGPSTPAEVLFRGADHGLVPGRDDTIQFERSLSLDDAMGSNAILAYAMNGEALPIQHGAPVRLVVPGWYAVSSVKWLTDIEVIGERFEGQYQTGSYYYEWERDDRVVREPVSLQRVRSLITEPAAGA